MAKKVVTCPECTAEEFGVTIDTETGTETIWCRCCQKDYKQINKLGAVGLVHRCKCDHHHN